MLKKNKMRIFLIYIILLFTYSCKAQNTNVFRSNIISFFKVDDKDIQKCQKEKKRLLKKNIEITNIETIYNQCIGYYEYLNFYRDNTLQMLEKVSEQKDFIIINYISDNSYSPHRTKTILKIDNNYYGLKHYFEDENNQFVEKNEEFEVSQLDKENIQKIQEYLSTGKSEYVSNKSAGLIGNNTKWYVIEKSNSRVSMIELFRIK